MKVVWYVPCIILISIAIIVHWAWFFTLSPITHGDWGFSFREEQQSLLALPQIWDSSALGGVNLTGPTHFPLNIARGLLSRIASEPVVERILILFPIAFLLPIGSFLLVYRMTGSAIGAVAGSLVYSYNTYIFITSNLLLVVAFALAPIALLLYIGSLERKSLWRAVLCGIVLYILSIYEFRAFYIVAWVLIFFALYHAALAGKKFFSGQMFRHFVLAVVPMCVVISLNFFWLLGFNRIQTLASNEIFDRGLFGNEFLSIERALTFFHPFWTGTSFTTFLINPIPLYFWLIPALALLGLVVNRRNPFIMFFGLTAILGIFLSKQVSIPFTEAYSWLYEFFPGFNAFREASKFYMVIGLSYSVLIGAFVAWLSRTKTPIAIFRYAKIPVIAGVAFIFLWTLKPVLTGEIGTLYVPREVPGDYRVLKDVILRDREFYRTFWLPVSSRFSYSELDHPKVSASEILNILGANTAVSDRPAHIEINSFMSGYLGEPILSRISARYVIVPIRDIENDDDFFVHYGARENPEIRQWYIDQLDRLAYMRRIDVGTDSLAVYELEDPAPYIRSFALLNRFPTLDYLDRKYRFTTIMLGRDFDFVISASDTENIPSSLVRPVFGQLTAGDIQNGEIARTLEQTGFPMRLFMPHDAISVNRDARTVTIQNYSTGTTTSRPPTIVDYMQPLVLKYETDPPLQNIVSNPSFELGSWQEEVGDCNRHDDNPILAMDIAGDASAGRSSLELTAVRHIACVSQTIQVEGGREHLLSFDYRALNGEEVGYYVGFDPGAATTSGITSISGTIEVTDHAWHEFNKTIRVPEGATAASLYLYSFSVDEVTPIVTRYDDVRLIPLPDDLLDYWLVSDAAAPAKRNFSEPRNVQFEILSPTKKAVQIEGASTSFYLAMSETYHPEWRAIFRNEKINGVLSRFMPWAEPDSIPGEQHFAVEGFLNGWYVDVDRYCREENLCPRNTDGTYDISLQIEFWPQRWFYFGLIFSGTALFVILAYLGWAGLRAMRSRHAMLNV